jgi:biofilm PGA synthesis N-glycosyltransferase PgaC
VIDLLQFLAIVSSCAYAVLLIVCFSAFRTFRTRTNPGPFQHSVAVVVAARNEEDSISDLLQALEQQETDQQFEVIIVDDASSDRTVQIAQAHWQRKFRLRVIPCGGAGKKDALTTGIISTEADIILVTDADCLPGVQWIRSLSHQFSDEQCQFVAGTIKPKNETGMIESTLATETIFLQIVSAGMFSLGNPVMCNGASMGFRRKFFFETGGFSNDVFASGDDIALLHKAKAYGRNCIRWVTEKAAMVETPVANTFGEAIEQRNRWLSKMKAYSGTSQFLTGIVFLGMQLLLPLTILWFLIFGMHHNPFIAAFEIKIGVELLLLSLAASFFSEISIICMFPLSLIAYCIISIGAVIQLINGDVTWKGRTWKSGKVR